MATAVKMQSYLLIVFAVSLMNGVTAEAGWPWSSATCSGRQFQGSQMGRTGLATGGSRQKYKFGELWPPYPRPTGPKQHYWNRYHHAHYWPYPLYLPGPGIRSGYHGPADSQWLDRTEYTVCLSLRQRW